jgi:hypothetical protein
MTQDAFRQEKWRLETAFVQRLAAVPLDVIPEQAHMWSMAKQFSAASESVVEAKGVDAVGGIYGHIMHKVATRAQLVPTRFCTCWHCRLHWNVTGACCIITSCRP